MSLRVRFDFKEPIVIMADIDRPIVLSGAYIGIQTIGDPEIFDLHETSADGEPIGPVLSQMGCAISEVG